MIDRKASSEEKIALFRSLFRGNEEIYPRKYLNRKTGEEGYSPACGNEWLPGICEKPMIRCYHCRHQRFESVTDEVVHWHLSGHDYAGRAFALSLYPVRLDETCFFLVFVCDKEGWREDARAFVKAGRKLGLFVAMERTKTGARAWLFFQEAMPLSLARKVGFCVLTEAMEERPEMGLDSYDKFNPIQDTLSKWDFGGYIVLPLQKNARDLGHSFFVDANFEPFDDQWAFLSKIKKIERQSAEEWVREAEDKDRVVCVRGVGMENTKPKTPCSENVEIVLNNQICISKTGLTSYFRNKLIRLAAFQNPQFFQKQAMRASVDGEPRVIGCAFEDEHHVRLPRGCLEEVLQLAAGHLIQDERETGNQLNVNFIGELSKEQQASADAMAAHDMGILSAPTAFGKSVIAAWLIARRKVSTLVLVHRRQLMEQWIERLAQFLDISCIGRMGGGRKQATGLLDVALIQSLHDEQISQYGQLIVDECHHVPANRFTQLMSKAKAKYVCGLSATLVRKDGRHPVIPMLCGPVRYQAVLASSFERKVFVRPTSFRPKQALSADARLQFRELCQELVDDEIRNKFIAEDVLSVAQQGHYPLVLTERNGHLEILRALLEPHLGHLFVLQGGMKTHELNAITKCLGELPEHEPRVLLATGRFLGEGFDDARLDTLFLTLPISWSGTLEQYVGRMHRMHERKSEVRVYDYADLNVPMFGRMFKRRCKGYEALGYQVLMQGGVIPGWPVEVPLPQDQNWKNDYGTTVQRLIRDGVDGELAILFTKSYSKDAEGARSASEKFLFHRLQKLPQTAGRFLLNGLLPIPFDSKGQMEVDLLCIDARIAVELDGPQHLADSEAYRRDRHKDRLLQENGYRVLRFLTEDVSKRLDTVLDIILRSIILSVQPRRNSVRDLSSSELP